MHIPENYLSPQTCAVMTIVMVPVWIHSIKKVNKELPKDKIPMIGVGAAFSFLAMMFNVPLVGGTTGHAVGGTLIALLFGPDAACIAVSVALLLQAVIFGDGGILSFGANCFNMAFILPFIGYYLYKLILKLLKKDNLKNRSIASFISSYVGLNVAALCCAIEFGIQPLLFKDALGNALYCPYSLSVSIPSMMIPHLLVAGIIEAIFTVVVYGYIYKSAPNFIYDESLESKQSSNKTIYGLIGALVVLTPLGLLAIGTAWGEWDVTEVVSMIGYAPKGLASGFSFNAFMPDYAIEGYNEVLIYILSAIIGVTLLIIIFKILGNIMKGKQDIA